MEDNKRELSPCFFRECPILEEKDDWLVAKQVLVRKFELDNFLSQYFKFEFAVQRGNNGQGYVSLDDITFYTWEDCVLQPPNAEPTTTTKTPTTTPPTTTIEPTEPPDCM